MYDTICEIKSLLFNEISFFMYKNLIKTIFPLDKVFSNLQYFTLFNI
jgi:hypothetical protein